MNTLTEYEVSKLDKPRLTNLHARLHAYWDRLNKDEHKFDVAKVINLHIATVRRMRKIEVAHNTTDGLDSYTYFNVNKSLSPSSTGQGAEWASTDMQGIREGKIKYLVGMTGKKYGDIVLNGVKLKVMPPVKINEAQYVNLADDIGMTLQQAKEKYGKFNEIYLYAFRIEKALGANSPTLAYRAVYGEWPSKYIPGRTGDKEKEWKDGVLVDEHIDTKWLDKIDSIEWLELRASCEGHSKDRPCYIVFRVKDDKDIDKLVEKLNTVDGLYVYSDAGQQDRPRICVAGKTFYSEDNWKDWWELLVRSLSEYIAKSLFLCECVECGKQIESDKHCTEISCPDCGSEMRRAERPGIGKNAEDDRHLFDIKKDDEGEYVLQEHTQGLKEEDAKIGTSVHTDLRMLITNADKCIGVTLAGDKFLEAKKKTLIVEFKKPHDKAWLERGRDKPYISEDISVADGTWGRMVAIDNGKFKVIEAEKHSIQIEFSGDKLKGIWNMTGFPQEDTRVWNMFAKEGDK